MVEKYQRAIALLMKTSLLSDFKAYHCLLHQQSLCEKDITVVDVMTTVVKIVNYICAQPLHRHEFRLLLDAYSMSMVFFCCILRFGGYPEVTY